MTTLADQRRLIIALQEAHAAQVIETHISWVLLIGEYAYKIKKAVDLGFLDYSSLSLREYFCAEELRLNRRTAPDLYLEVVSIGGIVEAPQLAARPAIEYAVKMRRFTDDALMDARLRQGAVQASHIDALAAEMVRFHAQAVELDPHSSYATAESIRAAAMQNFAQMRTLLHDESDLQQLVALQRRTEEEWQACRALFESRRSAGAVRECHGDLHLGNIAFIGERPVPFDCIEFSPSLRWIDVMDEVAFTMMDLLHHGRSDLAWRYLNAYLEASGDYAGVGVLRFYLAYRAAVRAKVEAIRASQSAHRAQARRQMLQTSRAYLGLAQACLSGRHAALIITHGLPGSGKTTFAQYALEQIGAVRIRSDVERKRLFGLSALEQSSRLDTDIYSRDATQRTYARLHELAHMLLGLGYTVLVDAAFLRIEERQQFRALALSLDVPFAIASLDAEMRILRERLERRRCDASEADVQVLGKLKTVRQELTVVELGEALHFDTARSPLSRMNNSGWRGLLQRIRSF
ncbi:MAG: AAA family ATPase [Sideroxydans sp.]|nr:AAA family ATPase [Sideroxydans sp.]